MRMIPCQWLLLVAFTVCAPAEEAAVKTRVFYTGHSFAGAPSNWLGILAKQAGIGGYENLGRQSLGGSQVIHHWNLADDKNAAKKALATGNVDILTLSPNMQTPDEGIDRFVDLAMKHNPQVRVMVQGSWMTWDGLGKSGIRNAERDSQPVSGVRERTEKHMGELRTQLAAINARHGRQVCTLIPVGTAVVRLREFIAEGRLPGFTKASQLFVDDIGHSHPVIPHVQTYMYFAAVFHRDPRGLRTGLGMNGWSVSKHGPMPPDLTPLLQQLAWETMQAEPLGGLPRK